LLFQLQASVLGIKGKESGLWLTPTATDIATRSDEALQKRKEYRKSIGRTTTPPGNLAEQVQYGKPTTNMYPTPVVSDHSPETIEKWKQRQEIKKKQGINLHFKLCHHVQMYPTPRAQEPGRTKEGYGRGLAELMEGKEQIKMYPTPTTQEIEHPKMTLTKTGRRISKDGKNSHSLNLADTVKMYPTPTAGCVEGGEQSSRIEMTEKGGFILRKKNKPEMTYGAKLSDAMLYLEKMYPTPTQDSASERTKKYKQGGMPLTVFVNQGKETGGKLNPNFVEFLMGYPMNWTKIDQAE
jgi:hypothetical protein